MDDFVLAYTLEHLEKNILDHKQVFSEYVAAVSDHTIKLVGRIDALEDEKTEANKSINSLLEVVNKLSNKLKDTQEELNKSHMANIKQEMVVRTLHNLQYFDAHDMHVDTFADTENIDFNRSIRAEWFQSLQAIGKSNNPYVKIKQESIPNRILISKDGSSDESIIQTFVLDKEQAIGKVSLYIEGHTNDSWMGVRVLLRKKLTDAPFITVNVPHETIRGGWLDVTLPKTMLKDNELYYVEIETKDPYGYKIGVDFVDRYLPGTSYSLYGGMHADNNYDIGFKIWCYPAIDENDGFLVTKSHRYDTMPRRIIFDTEETVAESSGVSYFVSRDGGINWKILQPRMETDLDDLPEGYELTLRAHLVGTARINAWGYVIKRGDAV